MKEKGGENMKNINHLTNYGVTFRIYPTDEQIEIIAQNSGCSRATWNILLHKYNTDYDTLANKLAIATTFLNMEDAKFSDVIKDTDLEWPKLGKYSDLLDEHPYLKQKGIIDSKALDLSRKHLNEAFAQFFKDMKKSSVSVKKGKPQFKKKDKYTMSYKTEVQGKKKTTLFNKKGYVNLPILKHVKVSKHCDIVGEVSTVKVYMDNLGKFYITCQVKNKNALINHVSERLADNSDVLGLDIGLTDAIITSDGHKIKHKVSNEELVRLEKKRLKYERQMARRVNGSGRYNKSRIKKSKIDKKIANKIKDSNHKVANEVLKLSDHFNIEDLQTKKMSENKRNKISMKRLRGRGLSNLLTIIEYKAESQGKSVKRIDKHYASTQLCSDCGHKNKALKGNCKIREWECPECGAMHDRDINAAINIREYKFA